MMQEAGIASFATARPSAPPVLPACSGSPARPVRVLALSSLFPNAGEPRHGIFLLHRLAHLARMPGLELRMVAPIPWLPFALRNNGRYGHYARAPQASSPEGIETLHPRYPVLPKMGMRVAPALMAAALLPSLRRIREEGFDFDVIDAYYVYPDGVAAALLGRILGRPVILTAFGTDVNLLPDYAMVRAQILWAARRAAGITAVCRALADRLVEIGAAPDKVQVILHGVDLDLFHPPEDRAALRRCLGFDRPTLLSVGHLIERKGHGVAIDALAALTGV
jgi:glycosyltransferase involved in cell wall biosynthesis